VETSPKQNPKTASDVMSADKTTKCALSSNNP
jgi:hypothetical protein